MKPLATIALAAALAGCATSPEEIETAYVSPVKYDAYNCNQIAMEMGGVTERTVALHRRLDKKASDDKIQAGVGAVLFWPALFFLEGGDGPEAAEYAGLKGDYAALRQAATQKQCDAATLPPAPESVIQAEAERRGAEAPAKSAID
jgi:hypothetical protein